MESLQTEDADCKNHPVKKLGTEHVTEFLGLIDTTQPSFFDIRRDFQPWDPLSIQPEDRYAGDFAHFEQYQNVQSFQYKAQGLDRALWRKPSNLSNMKFLM